MLNRTDDAGVFAVVAFLCHMITTIYCIVKSVKNLTAEKQHAVKKLTVVKMLTADKNLW